MKNRRKDRFANKPGEEVIDPTQPFGQGAFIQGGLMFVGFAAVPLVMLVWSGFAVAALLGAGIGIVLGGIVVSWLSWWSHKVLAGPPPINAPRSIRAPLGAASAIGVGVAGLISVWWSDSGQLFIGTMLGIIMAAFCGWMLLDMVRHNRRLARQQDERWRPRRESSERWRS